MLQETQDAVPAATPQPPRTCERDARLAAARARFSSELVARIERGLFETDQRSDRLVQAFDELPRGVGFQLLERALRERDPHPPGAPAALSELLEPLLQPPAWVDLQLVARGAAIWWRFFPANVIGLAGALLLGYQHGDLVKPQALNGRTQQLSGQRFEETGRWMFLATEPGGLQPGGAGFNETVKIRLVHALVRRRLRRCGEWDLIAWGEPIHATGMCLTNLAFLLLPLDVAGLLGMVHSEQELAALQMLWRWVGYLMGVPDDLLPESFAWANSFRAAARSILAPPDADSRMLVASALRSGVRAERVFPRPFWSCAAPIARPVASRAVFGTSYAILRHLYAQPGAPHVVIRLLRPWVLRRERRRLRGELGSDLSIALAERARFQRSRALLKAASQPLQPQHVDAV